MCSDYREWWSEWEHELHICTKINTNLKWKKNTHNTQHERRKNIHNGNEFTALYFIYLLLLLLLYLWVFILWAFFFFILSLFFFQWFDYLLLLRTILKVFVCKWAHFIFRSFWGYWTLNVLQVICVRYSSSLALFMFSSSSLRLFKNQFECFFVHLVSVLIETLKMRWTKEVHLRWTHNIIENKEKKLVCMW